MSSPEVADAPSASTPKLWCTCATGPDGETVLCLSGEIDIATRGVLGTVLAGAQELARPVVLDLGEVSFLDSSGIHELLLALQRGPVSVINARRPVYRCLAMAGLLEVLQVEAWKPDGWDVWPLS